MNTLNKFKSKSTSTSSKRVLETKKTTWKIGKATFKMTRFHYHPWKKYKAGLSWPTLSTLTWSKTWSTTSQIMCLGVSDQFRRRRDGLHSHYRSRSTCNSWSTSLKHHLPLCRTEIKRITPVYAPNYLRCRHANKYKACSRCNSLTAHTTAANGKISRAVLKA